MEREILAVLRSIDEKLSDIDNKLFALSIDISNINSNTSMNDSYLGDIDTASSAIRRTVKKIENNMS